MSCAAAVNMLCGLLKAFLDLPPTRLDGAISHLSQGCFIAAMIQPQGRLKVVNFSAHTPRPCLCLPQNLINDGLSWEASDTKQS